MSRSSPEVETTQDSPSSAVPAELEVVSAAAPTTPVRGEAVPVAVVPGSAGGAAAPACPPVPVLVRSVALQTDAVTCTVQLPVPPAQATVAVQTAVQMHNTTMRWVGATVTRGQQTVKAFTTTRSIQTEVADVADVWVQRGPDPALPGVARSACRDY